MKKLLCLFSLAFFASPGALAQQVFNNPSGTAISTALYEGGDITPTALSGNVNDYNPTNLSQARTLRIDGGAADRTITGLSGGAGGRIITLVNIGTTNSLILANESGSSGASNRFAFGANVTLGINSSITLKWDNTSSRWRTTNSVLPAPLGTAAGGTGGTTPQAAMAALHGVYVLGASAVVSSITGTTAETTLATIAVPANSMGANGVVRVTVQWGYSGGTNSWTPRIKFNGTAYSDPTAFGNTSLSGRTQTAFANRNATNSQVGMGVQQINWAGTTSAVTTSAHDTTTSLNVTLTCQLVSAADTCTMHSYLVELMVP